MQGTLSCNKASYRAGSTSYPISYYHGTLDPGCLLSISLSGLDGGDGNVCEKEQPCHWPPTDLPRKIYHLREDESFRIFCELLLLNPFGSFIEVRVGEWIHGPERSPN